MAAINSGKSALWGAAGAGLWLVLVYGLPLAWKASRNEIKWTPTAQRVIGIAALVVIYVGLGAVAAIFVGSESAKEAAGYGLGWQGVFGRYVKPPGQQGEV